MLLAIEIGGTKIQLAVAAGGGQQPIALERFTVDPARQATGILEELARRGRPLVQRHRPCAVGVGFGGPVDGRAGRVIKSHHVAGWDDFPLAEWCQRTFGLPAAVANDADVAGLAEARFGAGRGANPVFYVTIGTGIGGGLILDNAIYQGAGNAASEVGHLRPGPAADDPHDIVEARSAGWGIAATGRRMIDEHRSGPLAAAAAELLELVQGAPERLTAKLLGQAAAAGNPLARAVFDTAWQTLGWALAQVITLTSPQVIVVGGGVSLLGERLCLEPLREQIARYVFPPLAGTYEVRPAALGEEVVLHGALAIAADRAAQGHADR